MLLLLFCVTDAKKYVGSIHSKLCMDCYQTAADCVLIKTQLQPRKQMDP